MLTIAKAHAYGNDFLFIPFGEAEGRDPAELARAACDRHFGIGADGLILYRATARGASMRLWNADGSLAEISGNGVRCLGALLLEGREDVRPGLQFVIETDAGEKRLVLVTSDGKRHTFGAVMGAPRGIEWLQLEAAGERVRVIVMTIGNPQCVVMGPLDEERVRRLGPALEHHPRFPAGTNVEFAEIEAPDRVRMLIWERGVGPTLASGTGACAAAVAAIVSGGADRDLQVVAPGGTQRVQWRDEGLFLTGWAEVVLRGEWRA